MSEVRIAQAAEVKSWLDAGTLILIDVREPYEHEISHIVPSYLIPLGQFTYEKIPEKNPQKKLVLYCGSGKRSEQGCYQVLQEHPEVEIYNLKGGILAWEQCGFAVKG